MPFKAGGLLVKPGYTEHDLEEGIPKSLNDFQLFIQVVFHCGVSQCCLTWAVLSVKRQISVSLAQERREDILAADPILALESDPPAFLAMASAYWKEKLTDQERQKYQTRAKGTFRHTLNAH